MITFFFICIFGDSRKSKKISNITYAISNSNVPCNDTCVSTTINATDLKILQ